MVYDPNKKRDVRVDVPNHIDRFGDKVSNLIEELQQLSESIPEEFRSSFSFEIDSYDYDSTVTEFKCWYYRPETDDEVEARKERERALRDQRTQTEYHQFLALKKKFENGHG